MAAASLLRSLGPTYRYWKPIQTGPDNDSETVIELSGVTREQILSNAYSFSAGLSPHLAAKREGKQIERANLNLPDFSNLIVEGAGGLLVPFSDDVLQIDLIVEWKLPVLLVAKDRLGAINHTLLSLEACREKEIPVLGILLNQGTEDFGNFETLKHWAKCPVWMVPYSPNPMELFQAAGIELHLCHD